MADSQKVPPLPPSSEQRAKDLLVQLQDAMGRVRRTQVILGSLAALTFLFAVYLLLLGASGWLPGRVSGAPVAEELVILVGLFLLGVTAFLGKCFVERMDRMIFKRETESVVEGILEEDPGVKKRFNQEIISTIYEETLYQ